MQQQNIQMLTILTNEFQVLFVLKTFDAFFFSSILSILLLHLRSVLSMCILLHSTAVSHGVDPFCEVEI